MNPIVLGRLRRQAHGLIIYRSILIFLFLLSAFTAFPHLKAVIGLGALVFNQGIAALGHAALTHFTISNMLDDEAERKTRHTILLTGETSSQDELTEVEFWMEVNRRVEAEKMPPGKHVSGWSGAGLTIWNIASRALGDIALIMLAAFLTPAF